MSKEEYHHYAHGKLLLTGEYFVLDGAEALAVPTRLGQHFRAFSIKHKQSLVRWKSLDYKGRCWFEGKFHLNGKFYPSYLSDEATGKRILQFLNAALDMSSGKLVGLATEVETSLEFHREWGLGSSSTLVASFSKWLGLDAYDLLMQTFGGSGYDVACAGADGPIVYSKSSGNSSFDFVGLDWSFKEQLHFAYLGNKQDSRQGIRHYKKNPAKQAILSRISNLTHQIVNSADLLEFAQLIDEHEAIVSENLGLQKVKDLHFGDFNGSIKSLGAWGGDFVMVASDQAVADIQSYFTAKGIDVLFNWMELILDKPKIQ